MSEKCHNVLNCSWINSHQLLYQSQQGASTNSLAEFIIDHIIDVIWNSDKHMFVEMTLFQFLNFVAVVEKSACFFPSEQEVCFQGSLGFRKCIDRECLKSFFHQSQSHCILCMCCNVECKRFF